MIRFTVLAALAAGGCRKSEPTHPLRADGDCRPDQRTDTLPQFCGRAPRNVIMLSIDTLRADWVTPDTMPFFSKLSAQGFRLLDHAQCSNWTYAGTTCTLLGRSHLDEGFIPKLSGQYAEPMPDGTGFLATWLADAGLYGILVSSNSWLSSEWNNDQGYAVSDTAGPRVPQVYAQGERYLLDAQDRGRADRFFLHLHFVDPHAPYTAPERYSPELLDLEPLDLPIDTYDDHYDTINRYRTLSDEDQALLEAHLQARYKGELRYTDEQIEDIWETLDERGWLDDALVVVWSDHGEAFWSDHDRQTHAYSLYREESDGVAMLWARNMVPGSWEGPTEAMDLAPTILELLGLPRPVEVTGTIVGAAPSDRVRSAITYARSGVIQSVWREGLKLQFGWRGDVVLTDRTTDPAEVVNLYDPDDPRTQELWSVLKPQVEAADSLIEELEPEPVPGLWP